MRRLSLLTRFSIEDMPSPYNLFNSRTIGLVLLLTLAGFAFGQEITDPASVSKNSFTWTQEEREFGFMHYDEIFNAREVPHGDHMRQLPPGDPIAAFSEGGEKEEELNSYITEQEVAGLLILQDGKIRLERYALGFDEASRWSSQSVAKSVTSTLVGVAIKDGYINSVDDLVTDYIPDLRGSGYDSVTIHQLLTMTSGVRWYESFTDPNSDLFKYYNVPIDSGMDQTVSYMRKLPSEAEPGTRWVYKTGETNLIGVLVSAATGQTLSHYLSSKIWIPYGMEQDASWIINQSGQELAGCCLQVALRDFARYGQFVLEDGRINGESVVPDGWFETATHTQVNLWPGWGYGYQWWTLWDGTFKALGIHGQMIHIDPSRELVIVVASAWPEAESDSRRNAATSFMYTIAGVLDKE